MFKMRKLLGVIAIVAVIGFSFSACGDDDDDDGTIGKLTITNFTGSPGLTSGKWVDGSTSIQANIALLFTVGVPTYPDNTYPQAAKITGNSITLDVYLLDVEAETIVPYTGNCTISIGNLVLCDNEAEKNNQNGMYTEYDNKVDITFTNGSATIDFGNQMKAVN